MCLLLFQAVKHKRWDQTAVNSDWKRGTLLRNEVHSSMDTRLAYRLVVVTSPSPPHSLYSAQSSERLSRVIVGTDNQMLPNYGDRLIGQEWLGKRGKPQGSSPQISTELLEFAVRSEWRTTAHVCSLRRLLRCYALWLTKSLVTVLDLRLLHQHLIMGDYRALEKCQRASRNCCGTSAATIKLLALWTISHLERTLISVIIGHKSNVIKFGNMKTRILFIQIKYLYI
jgi:hypothetical protein